MYLRRLEVHGFKAFADRQKFEFGNGMSVIVGPNGSGKSNVADSIKWALGAQSTKQIRARKTEDVIFSGSEKRRQMGMAEVTLTLDNSDGWMPIDFSEVSVTRRAHRSGESEYLINGAQVRLTDVLDLFRRAQVGQNSYAHMSQGLVDEVLAMRPSERREMIEEAADLKRHRQQLILSERRLVETRDNLGHVRMLIREVEPRLKQLERQSKKAEKYRALTSEFSSAFQFVIEYDLKTAKEKQVASQAKHDQNSQNFQMVQSRLENIEKQLLEIENNFKERSDALEQLQKTDRETSEEGLRLEQAVALGEQRMHLIQERTEELTEAISTKTFQNSPAQNDDEFIVQLSASVEKARGDLEIRKKAVVDIDTLTRDILRSLGENEARRARLEAEREDIERRLVEQESGREERERTRMAEQARFEELSDQIRTYRNRSAFRKGARKTLSHRIGEATQDLTRSEITSRKLQEDYYAIEKELTGVKGTLNALKEREELLERLLSTMSAGKGGSKSLINAAKNANNSEEKLVGIVDLLSSLIDVPEGLENAIAGALQEHLASLVVESSEDAFSAIEYLEKNSLGSTVVYPIKDLKHIYPLNIFNEKGIVGVAARLVSTDSLYRPLVDTLLGRVIIVEDLQTAKKISGRGLGTVVTRSGVVISPNGAISGGSVTAHMEQLQLKRELEAIPQKEDAAMDLVNEISKRAQIAEEKIKHQESLLVNDRMQLKNVEDGLRAFEQEKARERRICSQILAELKMLKLSMKTLITSEDTAEVLQAKKNDIRTELSSVSNEINVLRDRSTAVTSQRENMLSLLDDSTRVLASSEAESAAEIARRKEREEEYRRSIERLEQQQNQLSTLSREQQDLSLSLQDYKQRLINNRLVRRENQESIGPASDSVAQIERLERELRTKKQDEQRNLIEAERDLLSSENNLNETAKLVSNLLTEISLEGMELTSEGLVVMKVSNELNHVEESEPSAGEPQSTMLPMLPITGASDADVESLRTRVADLRLELRNLGPVNLEALEDLSEESERHTYLTNQIEDLELAENELRGAIKELRTLIKSKFLETFEVVNIRFGEYFQRFFGGGQAELRVTNIDDGEETEPGVDIFAQPPGKRISNLNVLSGGERSMTSVALLFALLSVNPAPMVVLDEVDAALDEANVGRFVETLRELREKTQFVMISHNRSTIESGDAIYGVSMGNDSTSQVLSLKIDQMSTVF
ncbi:MAG: chromosome segregation protein SMC [Chloroflexi bacterium]|nr:chromosome segregation protein SMC [Chloroflexota bacterium]